MASRSLQLSARPQGDEVWVDAQGSAEDIVDPRPLGRGFTLPRLDAFAHAVADAAARGEPLDRATTAEAQELHRALREADLGLPPRDGDVLVRIHAIGSRLAAVPWEAVCEPDHPRGYWGTSPSILTTRCVATARPMQTREISSALRFLAISHLGPEVPERLREAIGPRIDSGEVEWLPALVPPDAELDELPARIRKQPNIIHYVGHGRAGDLPMLQLAEDPEEPGGLVSAEALAKLIEYEKGAVRLLVLESCEGARRGDLSSAAELLAAKSGIHAVLAHLWPVRAAVARRFSSYFYEALVSSGQTRGDVAASLQHARLMLLEHEGGSAEAFSPVLFLRTNNPSLFEFKDVPGRAAAGPRPAAPATPPLARPLPAELRDLVGGDKGFSLLLGDRWKQDPMWRQSEESLERLRQLLLEELAKRGDVGDKVVHSSTSALMERAALLIDVRTIDKKFQAHFKEIEPPRLVESLARVLPPGVHLTLLRHPYLENAIARAHPEAGIYVAQPSPLANESAHLFRWDAEDGAWEEVIGSHAIDTLTDSLELSRDYVVIRPYRGYTPENDYERALTTEDHYLFEAQSLAEMLSHEPRLYEAIEASLQLKRPWLITGTSLVPWNHRKILHSFFERLPESSLAIANPAENEESLWENGQGLPGRKAIDCVTASSEELAAWLDAMPPPRVLRQGA
ncbi:MAG: CHAT domain-containing protein [Myxococcales bacterium]|nr:CHAT domain-containing protein [Myxococcales bacterium]MCB9718030.1 CHAT domain-containing protein [Myxococcales bacterium]